MFYFTPLGCSHIYILIFFLLKIYTFGDNWGFSQDGGVGRYASFPHTTKRRITTNLKTKTTRTARKLNCMEVWCVATLQGPTGSWYSCRRKNIHGAVGMSGMPLFVGKQVTHAASCISICMSHVVAPVPSMAPIVAPVPLHVSHHHRPQQGVPTCLSTTGEQSWKTARTLHNIT